MSQKLTGNRPYKMRNLSMSQRLTGNRPYKMCNLTMSQRLTGNRAKLDRLKNDPKLLKFR